MSGAEMSACMRCGALVPDEALFETSDQGVARPRWRSDYYCVCTRCFLSANDAEIGSAGLSFPNAEYVSKIRLVDSYGRDNPFLVYPPGMRVVSYKEQQRLDEQLRKLVIIRARCDCGEDFSFGYFYSAVAGHNSFLCLIVRCEHCQRAYTYRKTHNGPAAAILN